MLRTHTCGALTLKEKGKPVSLCGWVQATRNHGGIIFVDLRDRYGFTQLVFDAKVDKKTYTLAEKFNREDVLQVKGNVRFRGKDLVNPKLPTGEIEVVIEHAQILNKSAPLPIEPEDPNNTDEIRLKYRYLDLRRPVMQKRLEFRHDVTFAVREFLSSENFLEIETPLLVKSTPEGARDYVVPSRTNQGKFFALPQSPQLYKQILMIANFDRYFQLARCLRDEDLRADRQPEHTQIDLEMSFVDSDDVRKLIERMFKHIFKKTLNVNLADFPVLSYCESMAKYGTDKPDIRFDLFLHDVTSLVQKSEFNVFKNAEHTVALVVDKTLSRKEIDALTDVAKLYKAKGLAWFKVAEGKLDSGISKFLDANVQKSLVTLLGLKNNQTVVFVADQKKVAQTALGHVRLALRDALDLVKKDDFKFVWVKDFPLFAWNEDEKKWDPEHHMFSMPKAEFVDDFEKRPAEVLGDLWDLTLNGWELASGSIRVSNPDIQKRIMNFVGIDEKEAHAKFGFLLDAYQYGGPVHGGMGIGLDRVLALMLGVDDIREVIAFPKNKHAQCPMDGSPGVVDDVQLKELGISLKK